MSVFDRNVQHWARMDNPLNPIKKLAKDALKISGELVILDTLLHPIVISNRPLTNAWQSSLLTPKNERGKYITDAINEITLKRDSILNTTEKTITNPPTVSNVFTPLNTAFPNKQKNHSHLNF